MTFLLRLRTTHTLPTPSPSLLHHHHHRHLSSSSTSNSVSYALCKKRFPVLTFTNPSLLPHHRLLSTSAELHRLRSIPTWTTPSLLNHHPRRFLSTSTSGGGAGLNSNHFSPSSLIELRDAIERLSANDFILVSKNPTYTTFSLVPSSNSNIVRDSATAAAFAYFVATGELEEKLQRLKASALDLVQKQTTDRNRLWELKKSRIPLRKEILKNEARCINRVQEHKGSAVSPETCEMMVKEIDGLIAEMERFMEMTVEAAELLGVLLDSRLASLEEIVENLSEIREHLQEEVWDELNEGLVKGREAENKEAYVLAEEMKQQVEFLYHKGKNLFEIRHTYG